jgi:hypothetical protein
MCFFEARSHLPGWIFDRCRGGNWRRGSSHAREPVASSGNILQKRGTPEVVELELSLIGHGVHAGQERIDFSWVTHYQRSLTGPQQIAAEVGAIGGVVCEIANTPEAVVGSPPSQVLLEPKRKGGNDDGSGDGNPAAHNPLDRIPTLPHIGARSVGGGKLQDKLTHAGQDVYMLMPVNEIGGRAPRLLECVKLMREFGVNLPQVEPAEKCSAHQLTQGRQTATRRQTSRAGQWL